MIEDNCKNTSEEFPTNTSDEPADEGESLVALKVVPLTCSLLIPDHHHNDHDDDQNDDD